jgi:hypothetical protein
VVAPRHVFAALFLLLEAFGHEPGDEREALSVVTSCVVATAMAPSAPRTVPQIMSAAAPGPTTRPASMGLQHQRQRPQQPRRQRRRQQPRRQPRQLRTYREIRCLLSGIWPFWGAKRVGYARHRAVRRGDRARTLPATKTRALAPFAPLFSKGVWQHVQLLLARMIFAPSKRAVPLPCGRGFGGRTVVLPLPSGVEPRRLWSLL